MSSSRSSFNLCSRRATRMRDRARPAIWRANSRPSPAEAPVINALHLSTFILFLSNSERLMDFARNDRKRCQLAFCERPPVAARQIAKAHIADSDTHETFHFVANCVKHAANLPIDSLTQDHAQTSWCECVKPRDHSAIAVERNSAQQFRREPRIPWSIQCHLVFFLNLVARMREPLREVTIVCENEETFALRIEPADIEETRKLWGKKIKNRVARMRIPAGRDNAGRLVHNDVQRSFGVDEFPV